MATVVQGMAPLVRSEGRWFYLAMAGACAFIAFAGFIPTYWAPLLAGTLEVPFVRHVHAAMFFAWTLFFMMQAGLVARGQTRLHRRTGRVGVMLATGMVVSGVMAAAGSLELATAAGHGAAARAFMVVPLSGIAFFAVLVGIAIANVRRPDVHKRLLLVANIVILDAAMARLFLVALQPMGGGVPPVAVTLPPALAIDLLILAAIAYDWKSRGRPHPAYLYAGFAALAMQVFRLPVSETSVWLAFAHWFAAVMG